MKRVEALRRGVADRTALIKDYILNVGGFKMHLDSHGLKTIKQDILQTCLLRLYVFIFKLLNLFDSLK